MKKFSLALFAGLLAISATFASAQTAPRVVAACGTAPFTYTVGQSAPPTVDTNGTTCSAAATTDGVADASVRTDVVSSATSSPWMSSVGYGEFVFQGIANASGNTVVIEGSNDGGTTASILGFRNLSTSTSVNVTSIVPGAGIAYKPVTVMPLMRWRIFTYVAGSTTIAVGMKRTASVNSVDVAVSSLVTLPAGSNNIGAVYPVLAATSGAGTSLYSSYVLSSAATTNSNLVLTGVRRLMGGQVCNNNASSRQYVKLYNKATAPTVGTDTPLDIITIQPNSCVALDTFFTTFGQHFTLGLGVGITGAFAASDTTAVLANDVTINLLYL